MAQPRVIFCFGSNLIGRHAAGAARDAMDFWGAEDGYGEGPVGESYAIPTCDEHLRPLSVERIAEFVNDFIDYTLAHPEQTFYVTRIGCGIAGYASEQIAPLFVDAPSNVQLPAGWREMGVQP